MLLFDDLIEIPEFRGSPHIFGLHTIMNGLHMFECLSSTLKFLVLPIPSGQHPIPNNTILDILMDGSINIPEFFDCLFNNFFPKLLITIIFPNPIPPQRLQLFLNGIFLLEFLYLYLFCSLDLFGQGCLVELGFCWRHLRCCLLCLRWVECCAQHFLVLLLL